MEYLSFLVDFILLFGGLLAMRYARMIGGSIGHNSIQYMAGGFFMFGIAHLTETILATFFPEVSLEMLEMSHRIIVLIGFGLLLTGYRRLAQFVSM